MSAPVDPLARARTIARLLDSAVGIPGTGIRVGLDPLLGLVPGAGDVAGAVLSGYMILLGARLGAPPATIARMLVNVAVDTVAGTVPLLGDAIDVGWKSNMRNLALLERLTGQPVAARASSRAVVAGAMLALALLVIAGLTVAWLLLRAVFG
jgi:hypothetical protein